MKAKRGDLVVIERQNRGYINGEGSYERTEYEAGIVTSITRDGKIKAFRTQYGDPRPIDHVVGFSRSFIVPASEIDVDAATRAAWDNPWPHNPIHKGKPFDSLDEIKATLSPFKVVA